MNHLDKNHQTVGVLESLVPEAVVVGGSFAGWLPHPRTVPAEEREATIASAQETAVGLCVRGLLRRVGVDEDTRIATDQGSEREWPAGFVGSLTHKGTVVLGVIAPAAAVSMIGIDLERADRHDLAGIESSTAEGTAPGLEPGLARLLTFSAKEAVFKAQYRVTRRSLAFSDVQLIWEFGSRENIRGAVLGPVEGLVIRAAVVGRWIVSAAVSPVRTGGYAGDA
jgi:4'-phosphopantetheinyl transferase EntD